MGTRRAPRSRSKTKRLTHISSQRQQPATVGAPMAESIAQPDSASCATPETRCDTASPDPVLSEPAHADRSALKRVAAAALILGQNVSKTAAALGLNRRTVQRWGKSDPEFQTALAESRREVAVTSRQLLLALAESAVAEVETALAEEKNPRVAFALLRTTGMVSREAATSPVGQNCDVENENGAPSATYASTARLDAEKLIQNATLQPRTPLIPLEEQFADVYELADLPLQQQQVIRALFTGQSVEEVAQLAATSEDTVRQWLCHDERFFTVLSELQLNRVVQLKHRLLRLVAVSVDIVRKAIQAGDKRLAIALLRGLGMLN